LNGSVCAAEFSRDCFILFFLDVERNQLILSAETKTIIRIFYTEIYRTLSSDLLIKEINISLLKSVLNAEWEEMPYLIPI
jgi:hypothetical protein